MDSNPTRVFIVEDDPLVMEGYALAIDMEPDLEVCGEAQTASEALRQILSAGADIVIVDLSLPDMNGLELVPRLRERMPNLPVLVMSGHDSATYGPPALRAGAHGYITKSLVDTCLADVIRKVSGGEDRVVV